MEQNSNDKLSVTYAKAKLETEMAVNSVFNKYPLPFFLIEGILSEVLLKYKMESATELALDSYTQPAPVKAHTGTPEELKEFYNNQEVKADD